MRQEEIRRKVEMGEIKSLHRDRKEIVKSKEQAEEDAVGLNITEPELARMQETVQQAVDTLTNLTHQLKLEDKSRGLYSTVGKGAAKDAVIYPEAFEGRSGDNVFKFKQKFEQAIVDSQVREKESTLETQC